MHITNPSRSVRALATGAALVTCSLASAGGPSPLLFSTLDAASGFASLGSTTGTFSYTGPSTTMDVPLAIGAGSGSGAAEAYGVAGGLPGFDIDMFIVGIATTATYTSGVASLQFTVTLGNSAVFNDLSFFTGYASTWTLNSVGLVDGDTINAGTHTFVGSFLYSGTGITSYAVGFILAQASASAVPLPGAAGLAAIGLAGMSRRRRR
jgi:hypothetical protein